MVCFLWAHEPWNVGLNPARNLTWEDSHKMVPNGQGPGFEQTTKEKADRDAGISVPVV